MVAVSTYQYLENYLGDSRSKAILRYLKALNCELQLVRSRVSKLGDFKVRNDQRMITVNRQSNPYRFILTLMHELAHLKTFEEFGFKVKPHGAEWKNNFRQIMVLFQIQNLFQKDAELEQVYLQEMSHPKACAGVRLDREKTLRNFDDNKDLPLLEELQDGQEFLFRNKHYKKLTIRRTRALCLNLQNNRQYTIHRASQVEPVPTI